MLNYSPGKHEIKSGQEYETYFSPPDYKNTRPVKNASVPVTLEYMAKIVGQTLHHTAKISRHPNLSGKNTRETLQKVYQFTNDHLQYEQDKPNVEQLRSPRRSWADRISGVDCDCQSIFVSSILTNKRIPHLFRVASYESNGEFSHVYVVALDGNNEVIMDTVMNAFNVEKKYTKKSDYKMSNKNGLGYALEILDGVPAKVNPVNVKNINRLLDTIIAYIKKGYIINPAYEIAECDFIAALDAIRSSKNPANDYKSLADNEEEYWPKSNFFRLLYKYAINEINYEELKQSIPLVLSSNTLGGDGIWFNTDDRTSDVEYFSDAGSYWSAKPNGKLLIKLKTPLKEDSTFEKGKKILLVNSRRESYNTFLQIQDPIHYSADKKNIVAFGVAGGTYDGEKNPGEGAYIYVPGKQGISVGNSKALLFARNRQAFITLIRDLDIFMIGFQLLPGFFPWEIAELAGYTRGAHIKAQQVLPKLFAW